MDHGWSKSTFTDLAAGRGVGPIDVDCFFLWQQEVFASPKSHTILFKLHKKRNMSFHVLQSWVCVEHWMWLYCRGLDTSGWHHHRHQHHHRHHHLRHQCPQVNCLHKTRLFLFFFFTLYNVSGSLSESCSSGQLSGFSGEKIWENGMRVMVRSWRFV